MDVISSVLRCQVDTNVAARMAFTITKLNRDVKSIHDLQQYPQHLPQWVSRITSAFDYVENTGCFYLFCSEIQSFI